MNHVYLLFQHDVFISAHSTLESAMAYTPVKENHLWKSDFNKTVWTVVYKHMLYYIQKEEII